MILRRVLIVVLSASFCISFVRAASPPPPNPPQAQLTIPAEELLRRFEALEKEVARLSAEVARLEQQLDVSTCDAGQFPLCCPVGDTFCPATGCVDLNSDSFNCGACGNTCDAPLSCVLGVCALTCASSADCPPRGDTCWPDTGTCGCGSGPLCNRGQACLDRECVQCGATPESAGRSCKDLLRDCPGLPSGAYWIAPAGEAFQAYCDMETDGGGWTLVTNVVLETESPVDYTPITDYRQISTFGTKALAMGAGALNALRADMGFDTLRFQCRKDNPGRTVHIKTSSTPVLDYFTARTNTKPRASGSFSRFADDSSYVAANPTMWGYTGGRYQTDTWSCDCSEDDNRLHDHAFFVLNSWHWIVGGGDRWECDDFASPARKGYWKVFVR